MKVIIKYNGDNTISKWYIDIKYTPMIPMWMKYNKYMTFINSNYWK